MTDIIITVQDTVHPDSYVCKRMRAWFREYGFDFQDFKKNGISLDKLKATGDQSDKIAALERTARARMARSK